MENVITIELLGEEFKFKAETGSQVNPKEIADYVTEEVKQVESRFPEHSRKTNKLAIMVLATLKIATRHFELKLDHSEFIKAVSNRAANLEQKVESDI